MSAAEVIDAILAVPLAVLFVWFVVTWTYYPIRFFTVDLYRHVKYTQKGLCPKCHKPLRQTARPADQLYGPSEVVKSHCTCGAKPITQGNRRFADWADR